MNLSGPHGTVQDTSPNIMGFVMHTPKLLVQVENYHVDVDPHKIASPKPKGKSKIQCQEDMRRSSKNRKRRAWSSSTLTLLSLVGAKRLCLELIADNEEPKERKKLCLDEVCQRRRVLGSPVKDYKNS